MNATIPAESVAGNADYRRLSTIDGVRVDLRYATADNFAGRDLLEEQESEFSGKISWCEDGETVYVQPSSVSEQLDHVAEVLSRKEELKFVSLEDLVPGYVCAAEYQSELYRARIVSLSDKNEGLPDATRRVAVTR